MESDTSDSTCSGLAAASDCATGETAAAAKSHADDSAVHAAAAGDHPPAIPAAETAGGTPAATAAVSGAAKDPEGVGDTPASDDEHAVIMLLNWNSKTDTKKHNKISAADWKRCVGGLIAKLKPSLCCLQEIGWREGKILLHLEKGLEDVQKDDLKNSYHCIKGEGKGVCILYRKDHFDGNGKDISEEFYKILAEKAGYSKKEEAGCSKEEEAGCSKEEEDGCSKEKDAGCSEDDFAQLKGRILVVKLTAKDCGGILTASVHGRNNGLNASRKRQEQKWYRQAFDTLQGKHCLPLLIGADWNIEPRIEPDTLSQGILSPKKDRGRGMTESIELVLPYEGVPPSEVAPSSPGHLADKLKELSVDDTSSSTPQTPQNEVPSRKVECLAGYNLMAQDKDGEVEEGDANPDHHKQRCVIRDEVVGAYNKPNNHTPMLVLFMFDNPSTESNSFKSKDARESAGQVFDGPTEVQKIRKV